jgi:single-strand selective monofunctional uracil DNA glycosylase
MLPVSRDSMKPEETTLRLRSDVGRLRFSDPVTHVYSPLEYAWAAHRLYLHRFGRHRREIILLGINPGPWGMAQTGIPFGDVEMVRGWMGIEAPVGRPGTEHPRRPVEGFACRRSEVSGRRLWGWARDRFGTADRFFSRFMVVNYCPLSFMEASGRNRTPDRLPARERELLFAACDESLRRMMAHYRPELVIGIGRFAHQRAAVTVKDLPVTVALAPHPSPANPQANRGWDRQMTSVLQRLGIEPGS